MPSWERLIKYILDGATDDNGNLEVSVQDQTSEVIDLYLSRKLDDLTIDVNTAVDDTTVTVSTTGYVPLVGDYVCFKEGTAFYQGRVQSVALVSGNQYTVGLNSPLDFPFTTGGGCSITSIDMNVDGSTTPVIFSVSPALLDSDVKWDLSRMLLSIRDATAMDDGKFGGLDELTHGVVFRVKYNGERKNIFTVRSNGDFRLRAYDVQYVDDTLGPSGEYGLGVRRSFNGQDKNGVAIRLENDSEPDEFQILINDDLTGLTNFNAVLQGHVVE